MGKNLVILSVTIGFLCVAVMPESAFAEEREKSAEPPMVSRFGGWLDFTIDSQPFDFTVAPRPEDVEVYENHYGLCLSLDGCETKGRHVGAVVSGGIVYSESVYGVGFAGVSLMTRGIVGIAMGGNLSPTSIYGIGVGGLVGGLRGGGILCGAITGASAFQRGPIGLFYGVEIGLINLAGGAFGQVGVYNLAMYAGCQVGLINALDNAGSQLGIYNIASSGNDLSEFTLQVGLVNDSRGYSSTWGVNWKFGLLNRSTSGWWLPLSNCGF